MSLLQTEKVCKIYRMGSAEVSALAGVSLSIDRGEFVAILGTSGSGKSTLLNLFGGLDRPTEGEVRFDGENIGAYNARQMAQYRLRKVGMIFQSFNLIPSMSALENVGLSMAFAGLSRRERQLRAAQLLDGLGLGSRLDHKPSELSGGEQQRVSIARALANEPQVLLADEPTGNLDSVRAREVLEILKAQQKLGRTIVLITHDQELAASFADRVIRLKDGKVQEAA